MIRLRSDLALVLSGSLGCDLSDPLDCNAYAFDCGDGWAMVDAGAGRDPDATMAALDGLPVRWLLLTHAHADHSGGAAGLVERLGCALIAGEATAALMINGDPAAIGLTRAKAAGVYPADYVWRGTRVDAIAERTIRLGHRSIKVVPSAGHSADHVSYLVDDILCSGDALFAGGRVALQDLPDSSVPQTCATIRTFAALSFEVFLPGHGGFSLARGFRHAAEALASVERLVVPAAFAS